MLPKMTFLTFGIIADIQFADRDDGFDFLKINKRYYRNAMEQTKTAINYWNQNSSKVTFVLQLGDLLDGYNRSSGKREEALTEILETLSMFPGDIYHVWGNHELYNFSQEELLKSELNSSTNAGCEVDQGKGYYFFVPHKSLRILILNCYEINAIDKLSPHYQTAKEILKVNPNKDRNSSIGMDASTCRLVAYNGGIGDSQLQWIQSSLEEAENLSQNVIICGHCPIYEKCSSCHNLCWNYSAILDVIYKFSCVVAYLAGHEHPGGSGIDPAGIHHITFPGVIETSPDKACFATADLYHKMIHISGQGKVQDFDIPLKYPIGT